MQCTLGLNRAWHMAKGQQMLALNFERVKKKKNSVLPNDRCTASAQGLNPAD